MSRENTEYSNNKSLYSKMKQLSECRFAMVKWNDQEESSETAFINAKNYVASLDAPYFLFLNTNDPDQRLYFYDRNGKAKVPYQFGELAHKDPKTLQEIVQSIPIGYAENIFDYLKTKESGLLSASDLQQINAYLEKYKLSPDGFLTVMGDRASLDTRAIYETFKDSKGVCGTTLQPHAKQRLSCSESPSFELVIAFLDNNKDKKKINVYSQEIFTEEQKNLFKQMLSFFPNLEELNFPGVEKPQPQQVFEVASEDKWLLPYRTKSNDDLLAFLDELFQDENKKTKRLQFIQLLNQYAGSPNDARCKWLCNWTVEQNRSLLNKSFDCYVKSLQAKLESKLERVEKFKVASEIITELVKTKKPEANPVIVQTELQKELHTSMISYEKLGSLSSGRKSQLKELKNQLQNIHGQDCMTLLKKIQAAKNAVMKEDHELNMARSKSFFMSSRLMNRKGHSRFIHTLNDMYLLILKHGAGQLNSPDYENYLRDTFKDAVSHLYNIPGSHQELLKDMHQNPVKNIADILKAIKKRDDLPGHVQTIADEVIFHGDALRAHLLSQPPSENEGEDDTEGEHAQYH